MPIRNMATLPAALRELNPDIGVPADAAPEAAQALVDAGLRALLNFAPASLPPFMGVIVKNVDLTLFLENLSFQLAQR